MTNSPANKPKPDTGNTGKALVTCVLIFWAIWAMNTLFEGEWVERTTAILVGTTIALSAYVITRLSKTPKT